MAKIKESELSQEMRDYIREMNRLGELAESDGYAVHMLEVWTSPAPGSGKVALKICDLADYKDHREALARERFLSMVEKRAGEGCRMVEFEVPNGASWLCCFDTQGHDAGDLPIHAFANDQWLGDLRGYADWSGPVEEVSHLDVTDDPAEMLGGYDWWAAYPVQQLVPAEGLTEAMGEDRTEALRKALEGLVRALRGSEWCGNCSECMDASCPVPGAVDAAARALRA